MAQSSQHATQPTKAALGALSDLAFAEILARKLASLSAEQEAANSRLGILSCLAAEALKEDFPEQSDEEAPASSELSYDDTEDLDGVDDDDDFTEHTCRRFKSGERVRVPSKASPEGWRYLHIADLTVFPPKHSHNGCTYPVLIQCKPRIVKYLDSNTLTRVDPW